MSRFSIARPTPRAPETDEGAQTDRRSFLRATGYVGGATALAAVPIAVAVPDARAATAPAAGKVAPNPGGRVPEQPVMAYVHDAKAGIVVIMTGTTERTVKDRELVERLLTVPRKKRRRRRSRTYRDAARRVGRR